MRVLVSLSPNLQFAGGTFSRVQHPSSRAAFGPRFERYRSGGCPTLTVFKRGAFRCFSCLIAGIPSVSAASRAVRLRFGKTCRVREVFFRWTLISRASVADCEFLRGHSPACSTTPPYVRTALEPVRTVPLRGRKRGNRRESLPVSRQVPQRQR